MNKLKGRAVLYCPICKRIKEARSGWKEVDSEELAFIISNNTPPVRCPYCEIAYRGCDG